VARREKSLLLSKRKEKAFLSAKKKASPSSLEEISSSRGERKKAFVLAKKAENFSSRKEQRNLFFSTREKLKPFFCLRIRKKAFRPAEKKEHFHF